MLNFQGANICVVIVNYLLNSAQYSKQLSNNIKTGKEMKLDSATQSFMQKRFTIKRDSDTFDVTIRAYDGAKICELVGIFMLSFLSKKYSSNNISLYRDDGLSVFRNIRGKQAEKHKK